MSKLEFRNINFSYGDHQIYNNLSLDINSHEFLVIVGPSGSGKTTLLRIMAGFEKISSGSILYDNSELSEEEMKKMTAMVFQNYSLFKSMKVQQNIAYGIRHQKKSKQEKKSLILKVASSLNIDNLLNRYPAELSGGEQQRVGLARAIIRNPKIYLFDEPLSNLDASLKQAMFDEIKKIYSNSESIFMYVTHDQMEASILATKLLVMSEKKIEQVGTPQEVYKNPRNIFVANFFGNPKINLVEGTIITKKGNYYLKILDNQKILDKRKYDYNKLAPYQNKKVIVGIRPEDITFQKKGIKYKINKEEFVGNYSLIQLDIGTSLNMIKTSNIMTEFIDFNNILLFDPDSKMNLISS